MDEPIPDPLALPLPPEQSGRPSGTRFQERVMDAITDSEYRESVEAGMSLRRHGEALHISYDQAMEYLWPSETGF